MMKFACCLFLLVTLTEVCVDAFVIHPSPLPVSKLSNVTENDPRCEGKRNGLYPNLENCKAYYKCYNGTGQDKFCPEGMTFHNLKHCAFDENPACDGVEVTTPRVPCPGFYGIFPDPDDCHKYIMCYDNVPSERTCPENQWYSDVNGGCIVYDRCPQ